MRSPLPVLKPGDSPLIGYCAMWPCVGLMERIARDWDWVWIDAQHDDMDLREAVDLVRAADAEGLNSLVRVPGHDCAFIGKILDAGASGVIVPLVETPEEVRPLVAAAKFPPLGNRSYGGRRVVDRMGRQYYASANANTKLILQVESDAAVARSSELVGIPGVDGLFLGPDDLMIRRGADVDAVKDEQSLGAQTRVVADACRAAGKLSVGIASTDGLMAVARNAGMSLLAGGGDAAFVAQASKAASDKLKAYFSIPRKEARAKAGGSGGVY